MNDDLRHERPRTESIGREPIALSHTSLVAPEIEAPTPEEWCEAMLSTVIEVTIHTMNITRKSKARDREDDPTMLAPD